MALAPLYRCWGAQSGSAATWQATLVALWRRGQIPRGPGTSPCFLGLQFPPPIRLTTAVINGHGNAWVPLRPSAGAREMLPSLSRLPFLSPSSLLCVASLLSLSFSALFSLPISSHSPVFSSLSPPHTHPHPCPREHGREADDPGTKHFVTLLCPYQPDRLNNPEKSLSQVLQAWGFWAPCVWHRRKHDEALILISLEGKESPSLPDLSEVQTGLKMIRDWKQKYLSGLLDIPVKQRDASGWIFWGPRHLGRWRSHVSAISKDRRGCGGGRQPTWKSRKPVGNAARTGDTSGQPWAWWTGSLSPLSLSYVGLADTQNSIPLSVPGILQVSEVRQGWGSPGSAIWAHCQNYPFILLLIQQAFMKCPLCTRHWAQSSE